jgi:hypothetical protein
MKGFVKDLESIAVKNNDFRRVLYTAKHCQLVVMSLAPSEEIGEEVLTYYCHDRRLIFYGKMITLNPFHSAFGMR